MMNAYNKFLLYLLHSAERNRMTNITTYNETVTRQRLVDATASINEYTTFLIRERIFPKMAIDEYFSNCMKLSRVAIYLGEGTKGGDSHGERITPQEFSLRIAAEEMRKKAIADVIVANIKEYIDGKL